MKRLIICLDGTWNTPDQPGKITNVVKMMRAISPADGEVAQVVYYHKGVGTAGGLDKILGGAFGKGLIENVKVAYRFIANNYQPGDEIYIFGFSRGAYTARSLAGLIGWMGLIKKTELEKLTPYFDQYRARQQASPRPNAVAGITHPYPLPIECVGVWDTVGALGIPTKKLLANPLHKKYQFLDTTLGKHIQHAFHALAIDEKRGPFEPTLWSLKIGEDISTDRVRQAWFPGVHSNVGGSYPDSGLSDHALLWMIHCVRETTGLIFNDDYLQNTQHVQPDALGTHYDSLSMAYSFSRVLPFIRVLGGMPVPSAGLKGYLRRWLKRSHAPKQGYGYANEMIHRSALDRFDHDAPFMKGKKQSMEHYTPQNLALAKGSMAVAEYDGSISQP